MKQWIAMAVAASTLLGACGGGDDGTQSSQTTATTTCDKEDRDEPFTAGMTKTGTTAGVQVTLISSDPAPPALFGNDWVLEIKDASGQPLDGATVKVSPFMPDHNHGTNTPAVITSLGNGRYDANPVYFMMPAYWEVAVSVDTDTLSDSVVFKFCIE